MLQLYPPVFTITVFDLNISRGRAYTNLVFLRVIAVCLSRIYNFKEHRLNAVVAVVEPH